MKTPAELQRDVIDELDWEEGVDAARVGVTVHEGVVTLTGIVASEAEKHLAEQAARRVYGVHGVANELAVAPAAAPPADSALAEDAVRALARAPGVPAGRIQVVVEHGWVALEGEVDAESQRQAAVEAVGRLAGLKGVVDRVALRPAVTPEYVEATLAEVLRRSAADEARRIRVDTVGTRVVLTGKVRTWAEREDVERAAWSAPGVTAVESRLEIDTEALA